MGTTEAPFPGDVTWPVAVSLACTTAFFFGVLPALEDRSVGPQRKENMLQGKSSEKASRGPTHHSYSQAWQVSAGVSDPKPGCWLGGGAGNTVLGRRVFQGQKTQLPFSSNFSFHQQSLPLIPRKITSRLFGGNQKSHLNRQNLGTQCHGISPQLQMQRK